MKVLFRRGPLVYAAVLCLTLNSASTNAAQILAAVSVTSTAGGTISTTGLANGKGAGGSSSNCGSLAGTPGTCSASTSSGCDNNSSSSSINNIWNFGTFTVASGTNTYHFSLDNTSTSANSLNKLLCSGGTGNGCNVCICAGSGNDVTVLGTSCTASGGQITPVCDASGNVVSVTSDLTLTCP